MRNQKKLALLIPTFEELEKARTLFEEYEPRDLFYRAATELVALALAGKTKLSVTESIAVLLQTWNSQYYRFHTFDAEHFRALEAVLSLHQSILVACRPRSIDSFTTVDFPMINELFTSFELVLGPVGAAKALRSSGSPLLSVVG